MSLTARHAAGGKKAATAARLAALIVAYKIERAKGSEDASGYNIVRGLVERGIDVTLVSRRNNIARLATDPAFSGVRLVGVDVPPGLAWVKRGGRGIILYYYLWQLVVGMTVRRVQRERAFDVVHQLNFHADWAAHFLSNPAGKMVWGPIAHHQRTPAHFFTQRRAHLADALRTLVKLTFWHLDPMLRAAIRRSDRIFYANSNLAAPFQDSIGKIAIRTYAGGLDHSALAHEDEDVFRVLSVGRLVPLKGFVPAIRAFAQFARQARTKTELVIVGEGPQLADLRLLSVELGIADTVRFIPWIEREDLADVYASAQVFLYPSVEAQGLVVAEALSFGLPVVCTRATGPAELAGEAGFETTAEGAAHVDQLAERLAYLYAVWGGGDFAAVRETARARYENDLAWPRVVSTIASEYRSSDGRV